MSITRPSRTSTRLGVVAAGAALLLGVAAPALAASTVRTDPADASGSLTDLRRVAVDHGPNAVRVNVTFTDLQPTSDAGPAGMAIYLDTKPGRKGPEFRLDTGLQSGTDYQLTRARKWAPVGEPLSCTHRLKLDFAADVARFRVLRSCLGDPETVRVAVKMTDQYDGSHPIHDWIGAPRTFTTALTAG